ncbi:MAG: Transcription initiation factor IIB [Candidatus Thorarchaeota archaeon]|nr:MAG: Transcription initiation factor IIB [Candidatus Thorarchaeota archaeon]
MDQIKGVVSDKGVPEGEEPETVVCPECGSTSVVEDNTRGERACAECGLVLSDHRIDTGAEWRAFSAEESDSRSRVGAPMRYTVHDKGLSTVIDWRDRDTSGKKLSPNRRSQIYRLRKWQIRSRVHSSVDRNLAQAMSELERLASQLGITKPIREQAALLYRKAIQKKLVRGRSIEAMVAATLYAACRIRQKPRPLDEVADASRIDRKKLGQCYRLLLRSLKVRIPLSNPVDYISRFTSQLELSSSVQLRTIEILHRSRDIGLTIGRDPLGLAAAAIYVASIMLDERRTQREIAEVARVTEVTVRNRYKEIVKRLKIDSMGLPSSH